MNVLCLSASVLADRNVFDFFEYVVYTLYILGIY